MGREAYGVGAGAVPAGVAGGRGRGGGLAQTAAAEEGDSGSGPDGGMERV